MKRFSTPLFATVILHSFAFGQGSGSKIIEVDVCTSPSRIAAFNDRTVILTGELVGTEHGEFLRCPTAATFELNNAQWPAAICLVDPGSSQVLRPAKNTHTYTAMLPEHIELIRRAEKERKRVFVKVLGRIEVAPTIFESVLADGKARGVGIGWGYGFYAQIVAGVIYDPKVRAPVRQTPK